MTAAAAMADAHESAKPARDIEWLLVWAVKHHLADSIYTYFRSSPDSLERFLGTGYAIASTETARLMARLDRRGNRFSTEEPDCPEDALRIWAQAEACCRHWETRMTLIDCARNARRPDWGDGIPLIEWEPVHGDKTEPGRGYNGGTKAYYTPVRARRNDLEIELRRRSYSAWREALLATSDALRAVDDPLERWRIVDAEIPEEPWK